MSQVPYPPADSGVPSFWTVEAEPNGGRVLRFLGLSVAAHILLIGLLVVLAPYLPETAATRPLIALREQATELVAPPQLTQREPNKGPISKEFNVESLQNRNSRASTPSPPLSPRPALTGRQFRVPVPPSPAPAAKAIVPDAPNIDIGHSQPQGPPAGLGTTSALAPPPQVQSEEKPKLAFERPGVDSGVAGRRGTVAFPKPAATVDEAVRAAGHAGGAGLTLGDADEGSSAPLPGLRPAPAGTNARSSVQLMSDPQGVDFRPYLTRVLSAVRRNWFAVIPESARMGRQGRVLLRFSITRDGGVQSFQIAMASGTDAFDKAAVAGVSASQPFPPLPPEFKGGWIRLQLTFKYNMQ